VKYIFASTSIWKSRRRRFNPGGQVTLSSRELPSFLRSLANTRADESCSAANGSIEPFEAAVNGPELSPKSPVLSFRKRLDDLFQLQAHIVCL
jgi:hypothetical protein